MSKDDAGIGKYVPLVDYCDKCQRIVTFYKLKRGKAYICSDCRRHLYYQAGTIFHKSHISLTKWAITLYNLKQNEKLTVREIQESIHVANRTAWRMRKLLRENMDEADKFLQLYFHPEHFKEEVHEQIGSVVYWGFAKPKFTNGRRQQLMYLESIRITSKGKKAIKELKT